MKTFKKEELNKIKSAVAEAEKTTSGEIVPFVTEIADNYPGGTLSFSLVLVCLILSVYLMITPWPKVSSVLILQILALSLGFVLSSIFPVLKVKILNKEKVEEETRQRALQVFYEHGLANTRDKTGILIATFLTEKRVEIIADSGINEKIEQKVWDEVVELIISKAKDKKLVDGICDGIKKCGEILTKEFPIKADDKNELSDSLIVE